MALLSFFAFLDSVWPSWPGYDPHGLCLACLGNINQVVNMVRRVCRNSPVFGCAAKSLVRLAKHLGDVHQLDHIQWRQYLRKYSGLFKKKIMVLLFSIQYKHKKRCTSCQDHEEMKRLFKAKTKRTTTKNKKKARNKGGLTVGLEAIGKLCRHGPIIYW